MKTEVQDKCTQDQEELKRSIQDEINQKDSRIDVLNKAIKEKEKEIQEVIDKHNEEAKSKEALLEHFDSNEGKLLILSYIYSKTMGSKVDFTNDSELKINLSKDKGKFRNVYLAYC